MLEFEELRLRLTAMQPQLKDLKQALDIENLPGEIAQLEEKSSAPGFWDDIAASQKVLQLTSQKKSVLESFNKLEAAYDDTLTLIELAD